MRKKGCILTSTSGLQSLTVGKTRHQNTRQLRPLQPATETGWYETCLLLSVCGLWSRADLPEDELFVDTLLARQTRLGIFHSQSKRGSSTLELLLSSKGAEEDAQGDVTSPGILSEPVSGWLVGGNTQT